jgi:hypothetical protein
MSRPRTIRFGVMCDSTTLDAWQARCIKELLAIPGVELALIIGNHGRTTDTYQTPLRGALSQILDRVRHGWFLWTLYYLLWVKRRTPALQPVDMSGIFAGVPVLNCQVELRGRFSEHFQAKDIARIREHQLDFILRFGFNIIRGEVLASARHGVWSYHHDDPSAYRGRPAGFWEVFHGDACSGCVLQRLTDTLDGGHMLRRGIYATRPEYAQNLDNVLTASSGFAAHVCRELMDTGTEPVAACPPPARTIVYLPSEPQMVQYLARAAWRAVRHLAQRSLVRQWNVGLVELRPEDLVSGRRTAGLDARWLAPRRDGFVADPCVVQGDAGGVDLLVEFFDHRTTRGRIDALRVAPDGTLLRNEPAIDEPWHLSYPHVVRQGADVWCVPEAAEKRTLTAYRQDAASGRWSGQAIMEGVRGIDPTFVRHGGRWWMIYSDRRLSDTENLCVAWSDDITGPWTQHPRNPVKLDARSSRPAGESFVVDGQLYRPAQDCSRVYGGAVVINRIVRLDEERYEEVEVGRLEPDPRSAYPSGLHTISMRDGYAVIDGLRREFAPWIKVGHWLAERRR